MGRCSSRWCPTAQRVAKDRRPEVAGAIGEDKGCGNLLAVGAVRRKGELPECRVAEICQRPVILRGRAIRRGGRGDAVVASKWLQVGHVGAAGIAEGKQDADGLVRVNHAVGRAAPLSDTSADPAGIT